MEARLVEELPGDEGWQYEPKWDGFRCIVMRDAARIELQARSGKSLSRYFPEVVAAVAGLGARRFVLDGELAPADRRLCLGWLSAGDPQQGSGLPAARPLQ